MNATAVESLQTMADALQDGAVVHAVTQNFSVDEDAEEKT